MNASVANRWSQSRPISLEQALGPGKPGAPKPLEEGEPEIPITEPIPTKPNTPTRADCSLAIASPIDANARAMWQMMALTGGFWFMLALSAMAMPFEAALLNVTPDRRA